MAVIVIVSAVLERPIKISICAVHFYVSRAAWTHRMTMMMMPSRKHANEIDGQPGHADDEQLVGVHLWRVDEALDSLKYDEDADEDEEDTVGEPGERLHAAVAEGAERLISDPASQTAGLTAHP